MSLSQSGLLEVDPSRQWEWHEAHRDMAKNQYRTTYTDMIHAKETCLKSDFPSGYGGHIPNMRFDMLFRNTAFDRSIVLRRNDPSRDSHPSFKDHIAGIPTVCAKPQGAKKNPTFKVVPHDGTTGTPIAPWAVLNPVRPVPTFRNVPTTLQRARSNPCFGSSGQRSSPAARSVGVAMAATPNASSPTSPKDRVGFAVSMANQDGKNGRCMSEQEMLMEEVGGC